MARKGFCVVCQMQCSDEKLCDCCLHPEKYVEKLKDYEDCEDD